MKTRIVHTKIYKDSYFVGLSTEERLLFIYYITNEHINILGLYECPDRIVEFETGINQDLIQKIKLKLEQDEKIFFRGDWVFIKNAYRYQKYKGAKNEKAKADVFNALSRDLKDWIMDIIKKYSSYPLSELVLDTTIDTATILPKNKKSEPRSQNPETESLKEKHK